MRMLMLTVLLLVGCGTADEPRSVPGGEPPPERAASDTGDRPGDTSAAPPPSRVLSAATEYYTSGPQQGRPPDGVFPAGTAVEVVEQSGSYALVRTGDGVEAYVAADALERPAGTPAELSGLVDGMNQFACELYQGLRAKEGNLFLSPASVSIALAMTYAGSAGPTESEMARVLHFTMPRNELNEGMRTLLASWTALGGEKGIRFSVANRLWGQQDVEFLPAYVDVTRDAYGAEVARLDFHATEAARGTINRWVEDHTARRITELLPPGAISAGTKLVLTNAVYFHGTWSRPFDKERTRSETFHLAPSSEMEVPMMHHSGAFRYGEADGLKLLELPYGTGNLSMVVLLPDAVDGLSAIEARLTGENVARWLSGLKSEPSVTVSLPRFQAVSQFELRDTLESLGMGSAFDAQRADFSGMTGARDLFVSAVVHKAYVAADEQGTEAAAATGVFLEPTGAPIVREPRVFRADHPFAFIILEKRHGVLLFLGRIAAPATPADELPSRAGADGGR